MEEKRKREDLFSVEQHYQTIIVKSFGLKVYLFQNIMSFFFEKKIKWKSLIFLIMGNFKLLHTLK